MPLEYTRHDVTLTIRVQGHEALFDVQSGAAVNRLATSVTLLEDARLLMPALAAWKPLVEAASFATGGDVLLKRLVVRADNPRTAAVNWEAILRGIRKRPAPSVDFLVVRTSEVLARSVSRRFDFPARVLEIGTPQTVRSAARRILHGSSKEYALVVRSAGLANAVDVVTALKWRPVDIVHLHATAVHTALQKTSAGEPGALAWLVRHAELWETRLIVLEGLPADLGSLRQAAQRLIDRGGPAVFVVTPGTTTAATLYASILHDRPLDWCQQKLRGSALFAGGGRTEAVRFSSIGLELADPKMRAAILRWVQTNKVSPSAVIPAARLDRRDIVKLVGDVGEEVRLKVGNTLRLKPYSLAHSHRIARFGDILSSRLLDYGYATPPLDTQLVAFGSRTATTSIGTIASTVLGSAVPLQTVLRARTQKPLNALVAARLDNLARLARAAKFEDRESEGTLPLAAKAASLRKLLNRSASRPVPAATPPVRHVNAAFYSRRLSGRPRRIVQSGARLVPAEIVHLGISIGKEDALTVTVGDLVFADEAINWTTEMKGVWLEIAVTGIDFEVIGDPVQEVWLPAAGDTTLVTFAVRPQSQPPIPDVARLRFTVFYRNNVVQSFRTVAVLTSATGDPRTPLADALSLETTEVLDGDFGYLTRMEYSAVDPNDVRTLPDRTLSIVANQSAGQKIFSIKGTDFFSTTVNENVRLHVGPLREALIKASRNEVPEYRYDDQNVGKESELCDVLWDIASRGWELLSLLVPDEAQRSEVRARLGTGGVITAAHVDLPEVVPWSLIYDRAVDSHLTVTSSNWADERVPVYKVERAFCPAAMPLADGTMPVVECVKDRRCVLHETAIETRKRAGAPILCPETVICPQHFWGFMHQIEVPVQQAKSGRVAPIKPAVTGTQPVQVVAGFNDNVKLSEQHLTRIEGRIAELGNVVLLVSKRSPRDALLQILRQTEPDIVYLYCHAYLSTLQQPDHQHPNLDFGKRLDGDIAFAANFTGPAWKHAPLVFLNGCGTVGFTPAAPAEFITQFIQGRAASAVIGTEVTVWAELAEEVGREFLQDFLGRKPAGAALLRIRRQLLSKYNPLGLVYTLYGSAGVHLELT